MAAWIDFASGPLFIFAFVFMVLGLTRRFVLTLLDMFMARRRAGDKDIPYRALLWSTIKWLIPLGKLSNRPLYGMTTMVFHAAVIIVPLFLAGHILLWERTLGFAWPAIPGVLADSLTVAAVVTVALLVTFRLVSKATRSLSRPQDYIIPVLVALPFASGFLLTHPGSNPFSHGGTLLFHTLSADLVMFLMPITKLCHAALTPSVQAVSEIAWHFPPKAGSQVAVTLGKEGEAI